MAAAGAKNKEEVGRLNDLHLGLGCAPYGLYGVKHIDPISLESPCARWIASMRPRRGHR